MIVAQTTKLGEINALLDQKLTVAGWIGTSQVTITANSIFGTSPVELK